MNRGLILDEASKVLRKKRDQKFEKSRRSANATTTPTPSDRQKSNGQRATRRNECHVTKQQHTCSSNRWILMHWLRVSDFLSRCALLLRLATPAAGSYTPDMRTKRVERKEGGNRWWVGLGLFEAAHPIGFGPPKTSSNERGGQSQRSVGRR